MSTIPDELRQAAARAIADAKPDHRSGLRSQAVKLLRDADGARLLLRDYIAAVDEVLAVRTNVAALARFMTVPRPGAWLYRLPNGHDVSVIVDPHPSRPFRFEAIVDGGQPRPGLTSQQVEDILAVTAVLPDAPKE